jgi:hypothetical protein
MAVLACTWLMGTTAEENTQNPSRTERQYSLNTGDYVVPYYGPIQDLPMSFSYIPDTRASAYLNQPLLTYSAPGIYDKKWKNSLSNRINKISISFAHSSCFRRKVVSKIFQSSLWKACAVSSMSYLPNMS